MLDCRAVRLVERYAAYEWRRAWDDLVDRDGFEGLVFKWDAALYGAAWGRMKRSVDADEHRPRGVSNVARRANRV